MIRTNISKQDPKKGSTTQSKKTKKHGTGASSSGLTHEERARSFLLPTTDEAEGSVSCEWSEEQDPEDEGPADADSVPSILTIQKILRLILLLLMTTFGFLRDIQAGRKYRICLIGG